MTTATLLAAGTTAATSSDFTVAAGQPVRVAMTATSTTGRMTVFNVVLGVETLFATLSQSDPGVTISAAGTYRVKRPVLAVAAGVEVSTIVENHALMVLSASSGVSQGLGDTAGGSNNGIFQPSSKYRFCIPGRQFPGSGDAKDISPNNADAVRMASLTDAACWANPGYFTTGAGANLGLSIPSAKVQFDLAIQSIIFSIRIKKAGPVGAESIFGCADTITAQGFYISMRAASGSVSKVRPILNTSGGVVSGLADSLATFGEAAATDHVLTLAIDGVTKSVFLWCDGALSNTYTSAFTGGTTVANPFAFGLSIGSSGTTFAGQFSGAHLLVMNGGLPINVSLVAQKLASNPHAFITDSDMVF